MNVCANCICVENVMGHCPCFGFCLCWKNLIGCGETARNRASLLTILGHFMICSGSVKLWLFANDCSVINYRLVF